MKKLFLLLLLLSGVPAYAGKLLVLIIASDQFPVYIEEQKLWRSYMHYDRRRVEAYFIKSNPNLEEEFKIEGDIIWSRTKIGWIPQSSGIMDNTVLSIEAMLPRLKEFDYVLRTNLSSFYIFPRLFNYLRTLPKTKCYAGSHISQCYLSGSGFILSRDVAELMVTHRNKLLNITHIPDDLAIGDFMYEKEVPFIIHDRYDITSMEQWNDVKDKLPENIFQYRLRQSDDGKRNLDEPIIMQALIDKYYSGRRKFQKFGLRPNPDQS